MLVLVRWRIEHANALQTPVASSVWTSLELFVLLHVTPGTYIEVSAQCQHQKMISLDLRDLLGIGAAVC
jgi:hypothetical protein